MLPVTDALKRLILAQAPEDTIREAARRGGMVSLAEDGLLSKVMNGVTSAGELLRVAPRPPEMRTLCHVCGSAIGSDFAACAVCGPVSVAVVPIVDGPFSRTGNSVRIVPAQRIWRPRDSSWNASSISVVFLAMSVFPTTNVTIAEAHVTH